MFESLSERLGKIFEGLTGRGALSDADVDAALREALSRLPPAKAVGEVSKDMKLDRQELYARAMALQGK